MAHDFEKKEETENRGLPKDGTAQKESAAGIPNSLIMRIMEEPDAEEEADRLSRGVTSRTPDALRREMGSRLGADLSSVRFHSDSASLNKSRAMGARAWAQGNDVYFGRGGFEPSAAAHELVHTVQQGAVRGNVSQSMPLGAVQLLPGDGKDDNRIRNDDDPAQDAQQEKKDDASEVLEIEKKLFKYFATDEGVSLFTDFQGKLKDLLNKKFSRKEILYSPRASVRFLVRACYRDYTLRDILLEVVSNPVATKSDRKKRVREYKALIKELSSRLTAADAEELAIETGMFSGKPKFNRAKSRKSARAYDLQAGEDGLVSFNPNNLPELKKVQDAIDGANLPEQAYQIFAAYTGNPGGRYRDNFPDIKVDIRLFRNKLKHMARVVTDYPELKHMIGNMDVIDPDSKTLMATLGTRGGIRQAEFEYNKEPDREGPDADLERAEKDEENEKDPFHISPGDYHGTHELGHALASLLVEDTGRREKYYRENTLSKRMKDRSRDVPMPELNGSYNHPMSNQIAEERYELVENDMLETVLAKDKEKLQEQYGKINRRKHGKDQAGNGHFYLQEQIATQPLAKQGMTSEYGGRSAGEFFAEAVADVYSHGSSAKYMSKALVKEYEKRQKKKVRDRFDVNKKSWWQRLFGL